MKQTALLLDLGNEFRGGQRQVLYLAHHLAAHGTYAPVICTPAGSPLSTQASEAGLDVVEFPGRSDLDPRVLLALRRTVKTTHASLMHTNDAKAASVAAQYRLLCGRGVKLVHSRRVSYPLKNGWSRKKYQVADMTVGVSAEIREGLVASSLPRRKTAAIHSGIDPDRYPQKQGGRNPVLRIGTIGALTSQKGMDVFIRGLAGLQHKPDLPAWEAVIAGDGPLRSALEQLAASQGLADRLTFLGWRDSREVLPELDILAVSSTAGEGSNAVIKEGWAVGVALAVSDLVSNLELARHRENALVYPSTSPDRLAEALAEMMGDEPLCTTLVEQGRVDLAGYTDVVMARSYAALYDRLLSEHS